MRFFSVWMIPFWCLHELFRFLAKTEKSRQEGSRLLGKLIQLYFSLQNPCSAARLRAAKGKTDIQEYSISKNNRVEIKRGSTHWFSHNICDPCQSVIIAYLHILKQDKNTTYCYQDQQVCKHSTWSWLHYSGKEKAHQFVVSIRIIHG